MTGGTYKSIHNNVAGKTKKIATELILKHDWFKNLVTFLIFFGVFIFNQHFYPFVQVITSGNSVVPSIRFWMTEFFLSYFPCYCGEGGTGTDAVAPIRRLRSVTHKLFLRTFPLDCVCRNRYNARLKIVFKKENVFLLICCWIVFWPCDSRVSSFDFYRGRRHSSPC